LATTAASSLCFILSDMLDWSFGEEAGPDEGKLLDHQPLRLNNDDYERVQ
jgi:DNA (cytosine-5)-methyltransferase 1